MKRKRMYIRRWLPALFFGLTIAAGHVTASAQMDPDVRAALQSIGPEESLAIIVTFSDGVKVDSLTARNRKERRTAMIRSLRSATEAHQREMRALLRMGAAEKMRSLWLINGLAVTAKRDVVRQIADMPNVSGVRRDRLYHKDDLLMALQDDPEANIVQVGAPALWALGHFGQGTVVALMDTGADVQHPDLAVAWRGGSNSWLDPHGQRAMPFDSDPAGHGTGVLGIMVAGDAGGTTIGMAPKARWIAARLFDDAGMTSDSAIHQIFQWFLDPDGNPATDDAPDVINGSWGLTDSSGQAGPCINEFQQDIIALNAAGIATVFAAGNYGPNPATSISPANNAGAIAAGAINGSDLVFVESSRGPSTCDGRIYPDVMAPGVSILTTDRSFGGLLNYAVGSGTSFAAPHASGALALLAGAFPLATLDHLKGALIGSAVDLGAAGPDNDYGNGRINVDQVNGAYAYLRDTLGLLACIRPEIFLSSVPFHGPLGQPVTFAATVSGGTGPYTFEWDVNGDGAFDYTTHSPVNTIQHIYPAAYTGSVGLTVTDATACSANIIVADQWACPAIAASISSQPDPAFVGEPVVFSSTVSGGTLPYTYAWDLDGNGGIDCAADTCSLTYTAALNGTISLTVTDSTGCSTVAQMPFTVQPASSPPANADSGGGGGGGGGCFIGATQNGTEANLFKIFFFSAPPVYRR